MSLLHYALEQMSEVEGMTIYGPQDASNVQDL